MNDDRFFAGLNAEVGARDAPFLNFGYLAPGARRTSATATSAALVEQAIGGVDLTGRRVIDVGCGRGGALRLLADRAGARPVIGLDLDASALATARRRPRSSVPPVVRASALALPVRPASVDAIVNIESACLYGDLPRFHHEVAGTLVPGGHFLYADIMATEMIARAPVVFAPAGLTVITARDITAEVTASVQARAAATDAEVAEFLRWFADTLDGDDLAYGIIRAERTDSTAAARSTVSPAARTRLDQFATEAVARAEPLLP